MPGFFLGETPKGTSGTCPAVDSRGDCGQDRPARGTPGSPPPAAALHQPAGRPDPSAVAGRVPDRSPDPSSAPNTASRTSDFALPSSLPILEQPEAVLGRSPPPAN